MFPWCVGGGDVMHCDVERDVMWLAANGDEIMWLVVK